MIYAEILAGGKGTRMGESAVPKQFLPLQGKPIVIHTIEKFILSSRFEKIIVVSPPDWLEETQRLINQWLGTDHRLHVVAGGARRLDSIVSGIRHLEDAIGIHENDILVVHDAVRPFLTHRILNENVDAALQYGTVHTAVGATDTIIESDGKGEFIDSVPIRAQMYQGQTPQSFRIPEFLKIYEALSAEERTEVKDVCKLLSMNGHPVRIVRGEVFNITITTPYDLQVAEALFEDERVDL